MFKSFIILISTSALIGLCVSFGLVSDVMLGNIGTILFYLYFTCFLLSCLLVILAFFSNEANITIIFVPVGVLIGGFVFWTLAEGCGLLGMGLGMAIIDSIGQAQFEGIRGHLIKKITLWITPLKDKADVMIAHATVWLHHTLNKFLVVIEGMGGHLVEKITSLHLQSNLGHVMVWLNHTLPFLIYAFAAFLVVMLLLWCMRMREKRQILKLASDPKFTDLTRETSGVIWRLAGISSDSAGELLERFIRDHLFEPVGKREMHLLATCKFHTYRTRAASLNIAFKDMAKEYHVSAKEIRKLFIEHLRVEISSVHRLHEPISGMNAGALRHRG